MTESETRRAGYSPKEAAYQLSISRSHLYDLMTEGLIRSVYIGARRVIPTAEIDRLMREGTDGD